MNTDPTIESALLFLALLTLAALAAPAAARLARNLGVPTWTVSLGVAAANHAIAR